MPQLLPVETTMCSISDRTLARAMAQGSMNDAEAWVPRFFFTDLNVGADLPADAAIDRFQVRADSRADNEWLQVGLSDPQASLLSAQRVCLAAAVFLERDPRERHQARVRSEMLVSEAAIWDPTKGAPPESHLEGLFSDETQGPSKVFVPSAAGLAITGR